MAQDDYYNLLGVSRSATDDEIQKAYRKLARKYHPDLHADKEEKEKERAKQKFQKVQQAYDVLGDPSKRQMYDRMGPGFDQMGGGGNPFGGGQFGSGGIDLSQIFGGAGGAGGFEDIFRQMGGGGPMGGRPPGPQAPPKGVDAEQEITVPFATAVLGGQHQVSLQRRNGKVDRIDVKIPAGIEANKKIRLRGQGNAGGNGGPRGDLMITVKVAQHPNYSRKGLNLSVTVPISLIEAVEGAKIDIPTPHGTVSIKVPPNTSGGKSLRLKGMGIKSKDRSGDLIATLQIMVPEEVSEADIDMLKQLDPTWSNDSLRSELAW